MKRENEIEALLYFLPLALHVDPSLIKRGLAAAKELEKHVEFLFYSFGLCGNSLGDVEALMKENRIKVPTSILKDARGKLSTTVCVHL